MSDQVIEKLIKVYDKTFTQDQDGKRWNEVVTIVCEDNDFELVENEPMFSLVDGNKMCFVVGKGTIFSFKTKDDDTIRHGFIYLKTEGTIAFVESMEGSYV